MFQQKIKVVPGNDLPLKVRLCTSNGRLRYDIDPTKVTVSKVLFGSGREDKATEVTGWTLDGALLCFTIQSELLAKYGIYSLWIKATYTPGDVSQDVSLALGEVVEVVPFTQMSNTDEVTIEDMRLKDPDPHHKPLEPIEYVGLPNPPAGETLVIDALFIPAEYSDSEIETLKANLKTAIENATTAKELADNIRISMTDVVTNARIDEVQDDADERLGDVAEALHKINNGNLVGDPSYSTYAQVSEAAEDELKRDVSSFVHAIDPNIDEPTIAVIEGPSGDNRIVRTGRMLKGNRGGYFYEWLEYRNGNTPAFWYTEDADGSPAFPWNDGDPTASSVNYAVDGFEHVTIATSNDVAQLDQKLGNFSSSSDTIASQLEGLTATLSGVTYDSVLAELNS